MKTWVVGFLVMGACGVALAISEHAYSTFATAFLGGMYFGLMIAERKPGKGTNSTGPN